jgi:hypothetical protein
MNFFSYDISSLLHQDYRDPDAEFSRHRDNGNSRSYICADACGKQSGKIL